MRKWPVLDALFPEIRQKLLAVAFLSPEKWWYLSELVTHLGTSPSSLQRELDSLTKGGVLTRKEEGRRTYYKAEVDSPVFESLRELLSRTAGLLPALQSGLARFRDKIGGGAGFGAAAGGG